MSEFLAALAKLPPDQREALILIGALGFSHEEVGEYLRVRDRHHQEPREPRQESSRRTAVDRKSGGFRTRSDHPRGAEPILRLQSFQYE